jgi:hypothetical protein
MVAAELMKLGFNRENTLFADSTCPDEINRADPDDDLTLLLYRRWGQIFPLSGLAGVPFCGKSGWNAFCTHIPTDGNVVVLFAPHIGIHTDGGIGEIKRRGHSQNTYACGAGIKALLALQQDETEGDFKNGLLDQQMDMLKHILKPYYKDITESENQFVSLAYRYYDLIYDYLFKIINTNWMGPNSKLAILGGIMINCAGTKKDMFLPLHFDVRSLAKKTNLF